MTRRERIAARLMTFAAGMLITTAALGQEYPPPTMTEGPTEAPSHETVVAMQHAYEAVRGGNWWTVVALALSVSVLGARKFLGSSIGSKLLPDDASWRGVMRRWLLSGEGGVFLTVAGAFLSGAVSAFAAHIPFGSEWIDTVLKVGLAALGGYSGIKATIGEKAKEERVERRETTDALKSGLKAAP